MGDAGDISLAGHPDTPVRSFKSQEPCNLVGTGGKTQARCPPPWGDGKTLFRN
jgi:hypothetical protein